MTVPLFLKIPGTWPGIRHAVTTRALGNLSRTRAALGDPETSRNRLAARLGILPSDLVPIGLEHGVRVLRLGEEARGSGADRKVVHDTADAVFTDLPGLGLLVTSADCPAVLVAGGGLLGLAHAGWRGALRGVLPALLREMVAFGGLAPYALRVGLGPSICPSCFEVGPEVAREAVEGGYEARVLRRGGRLHLDLAGILQDQARAFGAGRITILDSCTRHEGAFWWSHRREGEAAGRFALAATLIPSRAG